MYHITSDAMRHPDHELIWNPTATKLWDLLAPAEGIWRQTYALSEEIVTVRQVTDATEELFTVEPIMRSTPIHESRNDLVLALGRARQRLVGLRAPGIPVPVNYALARQAESAHYFTRHGAR